MCDVAALQLMYSDADTGGSGAHAQAGAIANEAVLNIRTVRACRGEHDVLSRFSAKVGEITTEKLGGAWKAGLGFGIGNGVFFILYVIVFEVGPPFRCIPLHSIAVRCSPLQSIAVHSIPFYSSPVQSIAVHCSPLQFIAVHSIAFHCIQLQSTPSHFIPLHSTPLRAPFRSIPLHST